MHNCHSRTSCPLIDFKIGKRIEETLYLFNTILKGIIAYSRRSCPLIDFKIGKKIEETLYLFNIVLIGIIA